MADKRNHMRYITTDYITLKDEEGKLIASKVMLNEISFKGMSLHLKERIECGKIVQFELITEILGKPVIGKGVVKNVFEDKHRKGQIFRVGIEFKDIIENDISCILNEINRKLRQARIKSSSGGSFECGPI